ncbi:MAG: hypothetical protein EP344_16125 [Bacteroidetes bacterium]|nr:MAG: hypothetical protein EP344_16125 [Bacteroidota bacterium]
MKLRNVLLVFSFGILLSLYACGGDSGSADTSNAAGNTETPGATAMPDGNAGSGALDNGQVTPGGDVAPAPPPATANASAAPHYTCPNNCAGSGGAAAGNCPVCGTAYVHNQAFHSQGGNAPTPPAGTTNQATPPPPSPAQNAAGAYHYSCPKGCAGGSGTKGTCASCGGELAHNAAYHQ